MGRQGCRHSNGDEDVGFGRVIRQSAASVGVHIQRPSDNPAHNVLGLRSRQCGQPLMSVPVADSSP
jgi:hypothetical protein